MLILGPWFYRLASQLTHERRERIRSEERSELAAHLHDSVLQTLALIQRSNDAPRMAQLARTQERELREWLFGKTGTLVEETLTGALEALAGRCEARHPVKVDVDVIVVGDVALDESHEALIAASGEAITNAAVHSGADAISVYAEVEPALTTIYVRDDGRRLRRRCGARRPARHTGVDRRPDAAGRRLRRDQDRSRRGGRGHPHAVEIDQMTIRVFLVDDHRLFLSGVRTELGPDFEVV